MPQDTTPRGGGSLNGLPDRARIPQPKPGRTTDAPQAQTPQAQHAAAEAQHPAGRPPLPEHSKSMAADREPSQGSTLGRSDDVALDTGRASVTRQPGEEERKW